jgi:regulatory protein
MKAAYDAVLCFFSRAGVGMYKSRRSGSGKEWGAGRKGSGAGSLGEHSTGDSPDLPVIGAIVTAIEAHPKQPHMYRIVLKLELGESELGDREQHEQHQRYLSEATKPLNLDWNEEVDALIAGAKSSANEDEVDTFLAGAKSSGREGEALLTVHEDTLVGWRLLKGRELTAVEYETLKQDEQKEDAYRVSLGMLERKARTTAELSKALKSKGYAPEVVAGCLERLQTRRMLDDSAYAKRFTEQRAVGQRKGRLLIRQELLQRGVSRVDVEEAIGELDGQLEQDSALALARKKWSNIKGNDRERKQKLMAMLLRRGFLPGVVRNAVQQVATESIDEELSSDFDDNNPFDPEY